MASLSAVAKSVGVKNITVTVKVPENDVARLMYYLSCVLKGCGLDIIQDDLIDYKNYHRLSSKRQDQVFLAAYKYSPDELINKTIFHDADASVCNTNLNIFLQISEDTKLFHAQEQVLIVGERKSVTKIMIFRKAWLDKFYTQPMQRNVQRLKRAMIGVISNHCEHCAGRSGRCVCSDCPRTAESQCSPTLALTGLMTALSEALEESTQRKAVNRHCGHCKGHDATCGCEQGCVKPANAECFTVHKTVVCDACRTIQILGVRYKCVQCDNFDLCQTCYKGNKHDLTHTFYMIEQVGSQWQTLEPRMKPKSKLLHGFSVSKSASGSGSSGRKGFFYESMSIAEMKSYLKDNGVGCDDVFEKEDLCRKVWECYCDSVSAKELAQVIEDTGIDASGCRDIKSRRSIARAAFRAERPVQTSVTAFRRDEVVVLCGLKAGELNGMRGRVVVPDVGGRVDVLLEGSGRMVRVKRENLAPNVEIID